MAEHRERGRWDDYHVSLIRLLPLLCLSGCLHVSQDPWLAHDKALHFGAGAGIAVVGGPTAGCSAGVAKEAYDATGRGTPSWRDAAVTCVGALVATIAIECILNRAAAPSTPN